jgi:hypothetical protein
MDDSEDPEAWSAEAHFTSVNYQGKKTALLLFINRQILLFLYRYLANSDAYFMQTV